MLANKKAWETLPEDIRQITAKHLNEFALAQRTDTAKVNDRFARNWRRKV